MQLLYTLCIFSSFFVTMIQGLLKEGNMYVCGSDK